MRIIARLMPVALIAACGGAPTHYSSVGQGSLENVVECAADAIGDEGFRITSRNDEAGLLNATYVGTDDEAEGSWLRVNVTPDDGLYYEVEIETSDTDRARDAAAEIAAECGTSS